MTAPDLLTPVRKSAPEWLEQPSAADLRDREAWAKANRAQINAEWNALVDPIAETRRELAEHNRANRAAIDAEWDALPAWPVKGMIG